METKKGVILCGGKGTRMLPATRVVNKQMIPVLNKPMVLYPLETLKALGIKDILIVSGGNHIGDLAEFLGDGSEYDVSLTYRVQKEAGGIAEALGLAKHFTMGQGIFVILGDNFFEKSFIQEEKTKSSLRLSPLVESDKACVFVKQVKDPERFGVAEFAGVEGEDWSTLRISRIVEKPKEPKTNFAVTGLYYYPQEVFEVIKTLKPSDRGELEISDVNNYFIEHGGLNHVEFQGFWSDMGTPESMLATIKHLHG